MTEIVHSNSVLTDGIINVKMKWGLIKVLNDDITAQLSELYWHIINCQTMKQEFLTELYCFCTFFILMKFNILICLTFQLQHVQWTLIYPATMGPSTVRNDWMCEALIDNVTEHTCTVYLHVIIIMIMIKINYSAHFNSLASFLYKPQVKGFVRVYHPQLIS